MPRATSQKFSRLHTSAAQSSKQVSAAESSASRNPLFNTDRFGQHILKNPEVAQA